MMDCWWISSARESLSSSSIARLISSSPWAPFRLCASVVCNTMSRCLASTTLRSGTCWIPPSRRSLRIPGHWGGSGRSCFSRAWPAIVVRQSTSSCRPGWWSGALERSQRRNPTLRGARLQPCLQIVEGAVEVHVDLALEDPEEDGSEQRLLDPIDLPLEQGPAILRR